jgi:predicted RNA binding protein YcfA (HicA-like mRNA interferase family)
LSRKAKVTRRLLERPADMRPSELQAVLVLHGWQCTRRRGSHSNCSSGNRRITVPLNVRELKKPYLVEAIRLLELGNFDEAQD